MPSSPSPTVSELRSLLSSLSLDSRGTKQTLKQRLLKHHQQQQKKSTSSSAITTTRRSRGKPIGQDYDSYLILDVEATCERIDGNPRLAFSYPNEIIEWPVILLQWRRRRRKVERSETSAEEEEDETQDDGEEEDDDEWELYQVDEFHSFVKPNWNSQLSPFCTELTGITQEQIDEAPRFPKLLRKFEKEFIKKHDLFTKENKTIWVTDGPWDLRDFIAKSCWLTKTPRPDYLAGEIIDLKLLVSHFFANLKQEKKKNRSSESTSPTSDSPPSSPPVLDDGDVECSSPSPTNASIPSQTLPHSTTTDSSTSTLIPTYLPNSQLTPPPEFSIPSLLSSLTLPPFIGRPHSGLSDTRNISRIFIDLAKRGQGVVELKGNRSVPDGGKGGKERKWGWMGRNGEIKWDSFREKEERRMSEKNERVEKA